MAEKIKIGGELVSTATGNKVADASAVKDEAKGNKSQAEFNSDVVRHENEINGSNGLDPRLRVVEQLAEISVGGGDIGIGTAADFESDNPEDLAKVPTIGAMLDGLNDGVYDVSKRNPTGGPNNDGKFTLEYILSNADTLIPTSRRHGGMTISFADSSDNKYKQYRLTAQTFTIDTNQWQGEELQKETVVGEYEREEHLFVDDNYNTQTPDETLVYAKIGSYGIKAKELYLQRNGSYKNFEELIEGKQDIIPQLQDDGEVYSYKDEHIFASDDYDIENPDDEKVYAAIGDYGIKAKQYFDMEGNPIVIKEDTRPYYAINEGERVTTAIIESLLANTDKTFVFSFSTDQHTTLGDNANTIAVYNGLKSLSKVSENVKMEFIVLGGDVAGYDYPNGIDGIDLNIWKENANIINCVGNATRVVSLIGNHDSRNTKTFNNKALYSAFIKNGIMDTEGMVYVDINSCYFDDNDNNIRWIFLDRFSKYGQSFIGNSTITLPQMLSSSRPNLIFSHDALCSGLDSNYFNMLSDDLTSILSNFVQGGGEIIACISGHAHCDAWQVLDGVLHITIAQGMTSSSEPSMGGISNVRTLGTVTETAWDAFIVNQTEHTIEALRYGCGADRKWSYKGNNIGLLDGYPKEIIRSI